MLKDRLARALRELWTSRCDVINYVNTIDENGITTTIKTIVAQNVPCRISYSSNNAGVQTNTTDNISQQIKLFISCDVEVKPGSEVIVTSKNGSVKKYIASGTPAEYTAHQEIVLTDKEVYA